MLKLRPAFKDYIWGGDKLKREYGKNCDAKIVAESWELSTHPDGLSTIENGEYQGKTLLSYIQDKGKSVLGTKCKTVDDLPILIKFIDARDNLSIQVHPDDSYALQNEGDYGKTEMWYVIEAEKGAQLVCGFNKEMTKKELEEAIKNNTLTHELYYVDVEKGDVFFIKPGTVHAIGKGIVIVEIQQRSNVTYRVYDYNRMGVDGKLRELHIDKSIDVLSLNRADQGKVDYHLISNEGYRYSDIIKCEYFNVSIIEVTESIDINVDETTFMALVVSEGEVVVRHEAENIVLTKGETIFLPAGSSTYSIKGEGRLIVSTL